MWDSRSFNTQSYDTRSWRFDERVQTLVKAGVSVFTPQHAAFIYSQDSLRCAVFTAPEAVTSTYREKVVRTQLVQVVAVVTRKAKRARQAPPPVAKSSKPSSQPPARAYSVTHPTTAVANPQSYRVSTRTEQGRQFVLAAEEQLFVTRKPRRDALKST